MLDVDEAIKELQDIEDSPDMDQATFAKAHKRVQEIGPKLKELVASLDKDQKPRFEKKAEQKVTKAQLEHRNKLQK